MCNFTRLSLIPISVTLSELAETLHEMWKFTCLSLIPLSVTLKCCNPVETLHEMWNLTRLSLIPLSVMKCETLHVWVWSHSLSWNVELYRFEFDPTLCHEMWNFTRLSFIPLCVTFSEMSNPADTLHEMWNFTRLSLIPLSLTFSEMSWPNGVLKLEKYMLKYTCKTLQYWCYVTSCEKCVWPGNRTRDLSLTVRMFLPPELAGLIPESVAVTVNMDSFAWAWGNFHVFLRFGIIGENYPHE